MIIIHAWKIAGGYECQYSDGVGIGGVGNTAQDAVANMLADNPAEGHEITPPDSTFGIPGIPVAEAPTPKVPKAFASTQQQ